ncbi:phosphatidylinositol 4,5-bisphosphate 3-kinase catalytic subunit beta isoform-like [Lingula anatina]|uniref:phosphatidylinositol 3-kinase n=1 Tax=Lingula anatina TaxID=7574 RepID=A0A1S3I9B1_LINAN|nr:phosphatidylinositol 4,5-bisphosphate 3-kinase catalytic subunit beta isoform-like [Lingula anatina]|eukprot:XP_013393974.2 phosphatidylinositol 4,5-bisphosphate 3-kinase catalytic subunit beta isoform-like [Lingula anatina]
MEVLLIYMCVLYCPVFPRLGLHEFDSMRNPEVTDFRQNMRRKAEEIAQERKKMTLLEKAKYLYPPNLDNNPTLPVYLAEKLKSNQLMVAVTIESGTEDIQQMTKNFRIPQEAHPKELIMLVLQKLSSTLGQALGDPTKFILKARGREEYLLDTGCNTITQYKYIREMISQGKIPHLLMTLKSRVPGLEDAVSENGISNSCPSPVPPPRPPKPKRGNTPSHSPKKPLKVNVPSPLRTDRRKTLGGVTSIWTINETFSITVNAIRNVNCNDDSKIHVRAGLFHGHDIMGDIKDTDFARLEDKKATWNQTLDFGISARDVPRMSRLCFSLLVIHGGKKGKGKEKRLAPNAVPLAWVNIMVFDYKDMLQQGPKQLHLWPLKDDITTEHSLHHIGTVVSNPNEESAPELLVTFHNFGCSDPVVFPPIATVLEFAHRHEEREEDGQPIYSMPDASNSTLQDLENMLYKDPFQQLHEQEKETVWNLREECKKHFPECLPKLLSCVTWDSHEKVAVMQALLSNWPKILQEHALELLDCSYASKAVRKFAVECLKDMSDTDLLQYLLQLVQVLKYEAYLENDLSEFLMQRALANQKIGHYFFWLLRSEMHVPSVSVKFGILLEAYCRGAVLHMKTLQRQVEALEKLRSINILVKGEQYSGKKQKALQDMHDVLRQKAYMEALSDLRAPLDPAWGCHKLKIEKCKVMDSKMKPLWLVWENQDSGADSSDIYIMFKNGDDLRQDMLTLQILHLMDSIWQAEGLDLRLIPYGCIATGPSSGMIELVTDSQTVANIQKQYASLALKSAFNKESLYLWLKENNTKASLESAIEEFTLSCAGYCVATYVLGIGDRHSDNIMIKRTGQLFHIDFGHFLGNFKSKFGIKRERVPFVLTNDFVHVINKSPHEDSFKRFRKCCERAFMCLRKKGNLLVTLFTMMLSTGLPELTCMKDISYLNDTLVLNYSEDEALKHFRSKFDEALKNSWKTSLNWAAHNMAKDNT